MPNEREYIYQPLKVVDYDIAGNSFRAYYDADDKLVFVIDFMINDVKPNVLLVISPVGMRKWDDILMNDYGVDLETVRPKKDNKYQKLDIEYTGLAAYDALIQAYNADDDLAASLVGLAEFRNAAARRSALERLGAADMTVARARETIEKTNETIAEQQARIKELRGKLASQRRDVGKEPTKQSAAKILRTESQIEAASDKLGRSKKRLVSAQHRLATAEDDKDVAQAILQALDAVGGVPAAPAPTDVMTVEPAPVPMQNVPQFTEITPYEDQPKAEEMADEEVKPLFDKDPEIMDDNIAFKPIDFSASTNVPVEPVAPVADVYSEPTPTMPLSFQPPVMSGGVAAEQNVVAEPVPMLDALTPVSLPSEQIDSELLATIEPAGLSAQPPVVPDAPMVSPAPVMPVEPVAPVASQPMPEIAPAPIGAESRPVSPIAGGAMSSTAQPAPVAARKPSAIYYVMLIVLIVLSIFTLWLYQKSTNDALPELGATTSATAENTDVKSDVKNDEVASPFIDANNADNVASDSDVVADSVSVADVAVADVAVAVDVEPEPVVVTPAVPIATTVADVEPEPVVVTPAPDVVSDVVVAEPVSTISPFLTEEPVAPVAPKPIVDVVVNKPAYNVSQNEKMFVAAPEYETDAPVEYYRPEPADSYIEDETAIVEETVETCADGNAPDADGCCAGEYLTDMGNGEYACCVDGTDECFPPMF